MTIGSEFRRGERMAFEDLWLIPLANFDVETWPQRGERIKEDPDRVI